jgi:lysophospholipase L1-like esterase
MRQHRAQAERAAAVAACLALALAAAPALAQAPPANPAEQPAAAYADPAVAPDFETRWLETVGAVAARQGHDDETRRQRRGSKENPGITILQLGDSHTAADFFTGELRKRLQALYGNGGAGYMTAGKPHLGVRSSTFKITASSGWTYKSLFKANDPAEFWLSGYNAIATEAGQTLTLESETAVPFDSIEIETVRQPGGGAIDIKLDGKVESRYDLKSDTLEPIVIRLNPGTGTSDKVRQIAITTTGAGTVNIASISSYNRRSGLTYSAVGFPGAQINLVDKFDERVLASELHRLSPHIVVLAFGTNEGFRDELDLDNYAKVYERTVTRIRSILPGAAIVVVAPPAGATKEGGECGRTPPTLQRVREIQEEIAKRNKLVYWNWASIMPEECGAHRWATMSPPLMAKDHVHLSIEGYKKSAAEFLNTLIPIIRELRARSNVVSNN